MQRSKPSMAFWLPILPYVLLDMQHILLNSLLNPSAWINWPMPRNKHHSLKDSCSSCADTIVGYLVIKELCQQKLHRRYSPLVCACSSNSWHGHSLNEWLSIFTCIKLIISFPSKDFRELYNWTSENFNISIKFLPLLISLLLFILVVWFFLGPTVILKWKHKRRKLSSLYTVFPTLVIV